MIELITVPLYMLGFMAACVAMVFLINLISKL